MRLLLLIVALLAGFAMSNQAYAASNDADPNACSAKKTDPNFGDPNGYDIAFIIDNRELEDHQDPEDKPSAQDAARKAAREAAREEDVKALEDMLYRHMFAEHIIKLKRPTLAVICDIFGACEEDRDNPWPPLITQIAHAELSRLYIYYLGPARIEGLERQLLFKRIRESKPGDVVPYALGRLQRQLAVTRPRSTLVMLDTSFAPRVLPCAGEDPLLVDATMLTVERAFEGVLKRNPPPDDVDELTATFPAQAAHCDRFDLISNDVERPLFTKFLLKAVVEGLADREPYGDDDEKIDLGELATYANDKVTRAVQFQWGRHQVVWRVGPSSRPLASTVPRSPTGDRCTNGHDTPDALTKAEKPVRTTKTSEQAPEDRKAQAGSSEADCLFGSDATGCRDSKLQVALSGGAAHCAGEPESEACPCTEGDTRDACLSAWCRWTITNLAGGSRGVVEALQGSPKGVCQWFGNDEDDADRGPLSQMFTPILFRLAESTAADIASCMLDCSSIEPIAAAPGVSDDPSKSGEPPKDEPEPASSAPGGSGQSRPDDDQELPAVEKTDPSDRKTAVSESSPAASSPTAEDPPPDPQAETGTAASESSPAASSSTADFDPSVNQTRFLQSALTVGNHNPGPIDGSLGSRTMEAVDSWRRANNRTGPPNMLTREEFEAIVLEYGHLFDQVHSMAPLF